MSSRRPSTDSPRSNEPSAAKKAPPPPRRTRPARPGEKEGSVESSPLMAARVEPPAPAPRVETPVAHRAETPVATHRVETPPTHRIEITEDQRRAMVAEAAYLRAERRGFEHGHDVEDWMAAEAEVNALLRAHHGTRPQ